MVWVCTSSTDRPWRLDGDWVDPSGYNGQEYEYDNVEAEDAKLVETSREHGEDGGREF